MGFVYLIQKQLTVLPECCRWKNADYLTQHVGNPQSEQLKAVGVEEVEEVAWKVALRVRKVSLQTVSEEG